MREEQRNEIEVHVAGICLRDNNGVIEVLAAKRAASRKLYPGKWECGGGQVNPGENFEEAIKRQHKEELNIDTRVIMPGGVYEIEAPDLSQKKIPGIYFVCEINSGEPRVDGRELTEHKWIPIAEIDNYDFIPSILPVIRRAAELYQKVAVVYVPCKDKDEAKRIGDSLIGKGLAACVNILPITSLYNWQGKHMDDSEAIMIAKSIKSKLQQVEKEIKRLHSYKTPAIIKFQADANKEYINWVKEEVNKK